MSSTETIYALATPPGRSGVAVFRLSGPECYDVALRLTARSKIVSREAMLCQLQDPETDLPIDQALMLYFPGPKSFTGEDVIEFHVHGSLAVISHLMQVLSSQSHLRLAQPGEFARRAYLNGKIDLLEAEALSDLIDSETIQQKSQAIRQLYGHNSQYFEAIRSNMVSVLAQLEAYIDFPDEDIPESVLQGLEDEKLSLIQSMREVMADEMRGQRLREGLTIVLLGAPNAGKSSLINRLAKRDVAIVSEQAGTTRDLIEVHLDIAGYPVVLVDTAGLREADKRSIEEEGIRRARERANKADLALYIRDLGDDSPAPDLAFLEGVEVLDVWNKMDAHPEVQKKAGVYLSARTGEGIADLLEAIENKVKNMLDGQDMPMITRARHREQMNEALVALERSRVPLPLELHCEELRVAATAIGKITGKIDVDALLDVIFSRFCIGK